MKYKYITTFSSKLRPLVSEEKDKYLSIASLQDIGEFIPEIDTQANIDLLPVAFNAFVANRANANGDILGTAEALAIHKNFANKPINIEHDRGKIIGVLLSSGFSEFGTDKPITEEQLKGSNKPFNVVLGGVIWRIADQSLAATIEDSSDPSSMRFGSISASWELGFAEFEVVKAGGTSKNIEDGTIINSSEFIASLGEDYGYGEPNGEGDILFRKPIGDIVPLGIGLTATPAADVIGIASPKTKEGAEQFEAGYDEDEDHEKNKKGEKKDGDKKPPFQKKEGEAKFFDPEEVRKAAEEFLADSGLTAEQFFDRLHEQYKKSTENQNKISQSSKKDVIENRREIKIMKITQVDQITDDAMSELKASAVRDFISEKIQEASEKYAADLKKAEDSHDVAKAQFEQMNKDHEAAKTKLEELEAEVKTLREEKAAAIKSEKFSERMASLDEKYDIADDARKVLAAQLKDVDSDEDFQAWSEGIAVFLKPFEKKQEKAEEKKDEKAEASKTVDEALDNGEKKDVKIPNSSEASDQKNQWADALKVEDIDFK